MILKGQAGGAAALAVRQSNRSLQQIGKMWSPGDILQVAYPIYFNDELNKWDLVVATSWGYPINPKLENFKLGRIFWPTHSKIVNGRPEVPDLAYKVSKIMKPLHDAQYFAELEELRNTEGLTSTALKKKEKELDRKYQIDDEGRIGSQPAVGRLKYMITTEVTAVRMVVDAETSMLKPDSSKIATVTQDLSTSKLQALLSLLESKVDKIPKDAKYLWVTYRFKDNAEKMHAGKVDPEFLPYEEAPDARFPEGNVGSKIKEELNQLSHDPEVMRNRNFAFHAGDERDLQTQVESYFLFTQKAFNSIDSENEDAARIYDRLGEIAKAAQDLGLKITSKTLQEKLEEYLKENAEKDAEDLNAAPKLDDFQEEIKNAEAEAEKRADESMAGGSNDFSTVGDGFDGEEAPY